MYRKLWKRRRSTKRKSCEPSRMRLTEDMLRDKYPEAFIDSVRETARKLSLFDQPPDIGEEYIATAGVGLNAFGKMQLFPLSSFDMDDLDHFPSAGQAALKEVHVARVMRAKEKTMDELKSILGRISLTLGSLKETEEQVSSLSPDTQEEMLREEKARRRERIRKKIMKRRKRQKELQREKEINALQEAEKEKLDSKKEVIEKYQNGEYQGETIPVSDDNGDEKDRDDVTDDEKGRDDVTDDEKGRDDVTDDEKGRDNAADDDDDWCSLSSDELDQYDSDFSDISSDEDDEQLLTLQPKSSIERLAQRRRRTSEAITRYFERCGERDDIMQQMQIWMTATTATSDNKLQESPLFRSDHKITSPDLLDDSKTDDIEFRIHTLRELMKRLKIISDDLGIGKIEEDMVDEIPDTATKKKLSIAQQKPKMEAKLYNEEDLVVPDNLTAAIDHLVKILEDAIKTTPARLQRISLTNGLKQFKFICKIIQHRDAKINALDKEVLKLGVDVTKNKKLVEELRKNKKKISVKCEKLEHVVKEQKNKLKAQDKQLNDLKKEVDDYKKKESYGLYDQSSLSSSSSSTSVSSHDQEEQKVTTVKTKHKKKAKGKVAEKKADKKEIVKETGTETEVFSEPKPSLDRTIKKDAKKDTEFYKPQEKDTEQQQTKQLESSQPPPAVDVEKTEVYLELKQQYEQACNEVEIEREKLAEFEKEFANVKNEKVLVEQEKSDLMIELENLKRQQEVETEELRDKIANFELESKKLRGEIECNEEMIQYQEDRINQYSEEIQAFQEKWMGQSLPGTPSISSTSFAKPSRRMSRKTSLAVEPPTARQMVAKIKQQYEAEIQGLKDFLAKENQRFNAEARRKEQEHKKDIQNIHKESLQVLRSINKFKDYAANLLERENLLAEAYTMRKLPPLPLDDTPGEVRMMLARMAILSNELLVSIELQLSKALMTKRLEIKGVAQSRAQDKRELEVHGDALRKAKEHESTQARKLKGAREELMEHESEFARFKLEEGLKQEVLEERYKELLGTYVALKREGTAARRPAVDKTEMEEKLERKEVIIKKSMRKEKVLNRALEDQRKVIISLTTAWRSRRFGQYYINKADQLENLQLIRESLQNDRVPKGLYEMTVNLIEEAIDLPKKRFIDLVQKYVRYVNMKEMEMRARRMKIEEDLGDSAMKFIQMLEKRIEKQQELWRKKKEAFIKKRAETLMNLSKVLTRVNEETDILMTLPKILIKRAGEAGVDEGVTEIPDLYDTVKLLKDREKAKELKGEMKMTTSQLEMSGPSPPTAFRVDVKVGPEWEAKQPNLHHVSIATPRILDLDVNMTRLAAQEIISQVTRGQWNQLSKSLPELKTFRAGRLSSFMQKSISQPTPKAMHSMPSKRSLTLPPIASFYSSHSNLTSTKREK